MVKRILVPLDNSEFSAAAIEYAAFVAKRQNASLTGLAIIDVPGIEHSIGPSGTAGIYWAERVEKHLTEDAQNRLKKVLDDFAAKCETMNIPHNEVLDSGSPAEKIFNYSMFFDLVVIGLQTHFNFETSPKPGHTLDKVLNHSITPVLGVPSSFKNIKNVLIGFDGSFAAAKALKKFIHLAMAKDLEIKIVIADKSEEEADYLKENVDSYFKSYGLTKYSFEISDQKFVDLLKENFYQWADLLVLGAHSKKSILEFLVGSATEFVINQADRPVFIGI